MTQTPQEEERRRHWRYPCIGEAWICTQGANVSLQARLIDISLGGCYLDTMNPFPSETVIELKLALGNRQVLAGGSVRASRQGFGMGVAFTEVGEAELTKLQELISSLAGPPPVESKSAAKPLDPEGVGNSPGSGKTRLGSGPNILDPLEPLLEMLERKCVITREEHEELSHRIEAAHLANKEREIFV